MSAARRPSVRPFPPHNKPFSSAGTRSKNHKKLFAQYAADDEIIQHRERKAKMNKDQHNRPQSSRDRGRPAQPTCDRNGAPTDTHRGVSTLRHKSMRGGWVGVGVPHGNRKLDHNKEFGWVPSPYSDPEIHNLYREQGEETRLTSNGFRLGNKPQPELFDPATRVMSANHTAAPDRRLLEWIEPGRASHARPFTYASAPREKRDDRGYIGSHKHFPHGHAPYEEYEPQQQVTHAGHENQGYGHRPAHYTSSMGVPWKPSINKKRGSPRNTTSMTDFHDHATMQIEKSRQNAI